MLNSHVWLVVTLLNSADIEHFCTSSQVVLPDSNNLYDFKPLERAIFINAAYLCHCVQSFSGVRLCPISNSKGLLYIPALHGLPFLMIPPSSCVFVTVPQSPYMLQEMVFLQVGRLAELWPPTSTLPRIPIHVSNSHKFSRHDNMKPSLSLLVSLLSLSSYVFPSPCVLNFQIQFPLNSNGNVKPFFYF